MYRASLILTPVSISPPDFNYNTDGYDGDAAEDHKSQDGSETMPFIDESPTISPSLCACGPDGDAISPVPPEDLLPGVSPIHTCVYAQTLGVKELTKLTVRYSSVTVRYFIQCLAKVFGPLELCDLLPHFRLQT